jgi:CheY-like chemotaxis protein/cytidylate kinase
MMSVISLFSGSFCAAEEVVDLVLDRTGLLRISDDDLVKRASEHSGMPKDKIARTLSAKTSVFNSFTGERERAIAQLRFAVAERLQEDTLLIDGLCTQLVPPTIGHVLRVCLISSLPARIERVTTENGLSEKEATRLIRRHDETRAAWVLEVTGSNDPWNPSLYDLLIPTDKSDPEAACELITANVAKDVVQPSPASRQAAVDFLTAARVGRELAENGHFVDVESSDGDVTLTINKNVLMLGRLENELTSIAETVAGVRSVETKVGKDFYQPDIYRKVDFEQPSRVLLVDDEREFVQTLSERLEMRDVGSAVAYDGESALRMVEDDEPDVIILDLRMPGIDGIEVLRQVKQSRPRIEVIILTGHGSEEDRRTCMELGAFAYLQKPADIDELSETLRQANEKARRSAAGDAALKDEAP